MERFEKQRQLGAGTYGVVYQGIEKATGRVVAMKKVKLGDNCREEGVSRSAIREIKVDSSAPPPARSSALSPRTIPPPNRSRAPSLADLAGIEGGPQPVRRGPCRRVSAQRQLVGRDGDV